MPSGWTGVYSDLSVDDTITPSHSNEAAGTWEINLLSPATAGVVAVLEHGD